MAVPHVLPESKINVFKFYDNHAIHEAILFQGNIMKLAGIFSGEQQQEAFDFAYTLAQDFFTLITPSSAVYRIWVDIRCRQDFRISFPLPPNSQPSASPVTNWPVARSDQAPQLTEALGFV